MKEDDCENIPAFEDVFRDEDEEEEQEDEGASIVVKLWKWMCSGFLLVQLS